jgi:hypothetical protein
VTVMVAVNVDKFIAVTVGVGVALALAVGARVAVAVYVTVGVPVAVLFRIAPFNIVGVEVLDGVGVGVEPLNVTIAAR